VSAPARTLAAGDRTLELAGRPLLMGIVNATPDSFSDAGAPQDLDGRVALAAQLLADGADIIDIGGESGRTDRPAVHADEEAARVVPLVERVAGDLGALVSVDTYKPSVAQAAVAAGARIVNDVSGLRDVGLADVCAGTGAALVLMHTVAPPKTKVLDHEYADVGNEVAEFLSDRMQTVRERGVAPEQILLDPGPDFGKRPAQTVAALRSLDHLHELGRPLLLAISRKDFIGAITSRPPRERLAGTLAALAFGVESGAHVMRVHDVREAREFLDVLETLRGTRAIDDAARLDEALRREPGDG
jgi:dihydropteroate synthase